MDIQFSGEYQWQPEWIIFPAVVDGTYIELRLTRNVLDDLLGANPNRSAEESAFNANRQRINEVARRMLRERVPLDGGVLVITDEFLQRDPTLARPR